MLKAAAARDGPTATSLARDVQDSSAAWAFGARSTSPSHIAKIQRARTTHRLIILGALLVATIFGAAGLLIATQRAAGLAEGQRAADNLAQVLAEQTSRTLQPVDLTLREVLGRVTAAGAANQDEATGWGSKAMFDLLVERLKGLPQADFLSMAGADGRLVNSSRRYPTAPLNISNRDYFQYLSTHDDHALFVSAPAQNYVDGKWNVLFVRRINGPRGAFAGVVMSAVALAYLEDFYRAVTPEGGAVTVLRRDGLILARYPVGPGTGTRIQAGAPWYDVVEKGGGSYHSPATAETTARLVSARPLREFPLVINVSTTETAALYGWRRQTLWLLTGAALAAGCVIVLLRVFALQYGRLAAQNALLETGRLRFDAVLDSISQGLTFFDHGGKLVLSNRRYAEIYKLSADQTRPGILLSDIIDYRIAKGSFPDMSPADYLERRENLVQNAVSFEIVDEFRDGRTVSMHYQPLHGGGWVATHEDITERRQAEATLAYMARHDTLTELPNRTLFQERLIHAIALTRRGGHCALLCLDLDRFKLINDTLGHAVGDGLLRAVAARLGNTVRADDMVARLGGDEFAIIQSDSKSPEHAARLAERIIEALREPYDIDGHRIIAGASIGVSMAPQDGTASDTLLKNADIALDLAKTEMRGGYRFFEPETDSYLRQRRAVELDLREALPAEHFELHYQPVLDVGTGRVTGFEALIRWNHPVRGRVSPAEFIPIAEETGLIVQIGAWALKRACVEAASWPGDIEIAVNLSPVQFKRGLLLDVVREALVVSGLDPNRLELEITESVLLENSGERLAVLHQLRALGIRIALDDFGTGYSSLGYLRSFPFNKIKIDQSFIREVNTNKQSAAIVGAIVGLGHSLGMTIVAEGVETSQQLATVRDQGCAKVQGYLFSRPCPASEVAALIRTLRVPGQNEPEPQRETAVARSDGDDASQVSVASASRGPSRNAGAVVAMPF